MLSFLNLQRPLCLNFKLKAFLALKFRFFKKASSALLAAELVLFCLFVKFLAVFVIHFCKLIAGFAISCLPDIFFVAKV